MKCLLNNPLINNTGWPINKKVKQEIDLRNDSKGISLKWKPFCYQHRTSKNFTYNGLTYSDKGQAKCFSSWSLLSLPSLSSKCVTNQFWTTQAKKPKNWAWACLHCLLIRQIKMAIVHEVIFSLVYKITLFTMCIKPMRFTTFLWYIRPLSLQCALNL